MQWSPDLRLTVTGSTRYYHQITETRTIRFRIEDPIFLKIQIKTDWLLQKCRKLFAFCKNCAVLIERFYTGIPNNNSSS